MWCSENERQGLRRISPAAYMCRSFASLTWPFCVLLTMVFCSLAIGQRLSLINALCLSSALFTLNAISYVSSEYLLHHTGFSYDEVEDSYVPTTHPFKSWRFLVGVATAATLYLFPILYALWYSSRFTRLAEFLGEDENGSIQIRLHRQNESYIRLKHGTTMTGCGGTWRLSENSQQINIQASQDEYLVLRVAGMEGLYEIEAQGFTRGEKFPRHCKLVKKHKTFLSP